MSEESPKESDDESTFGEQSLIKKQLAAQIALVKKLRAQQRSYLGHLGKLQQAVSATNEHTEEEVKVFNGRLLSLREKLYDLNTQIMNLVTEDAEVEAECNTEDQTATRLLEVEVRLATMMSKFNVSVPPGSRLSSPARSSSASTTFQASLPKLSLPTFAGEFREWRPFYDQFKAAVGDAEVPAVQKLSHLLACLRGDAKAAVAGLQCTASNYLVALKILKDRFGDPNLLITMYADQLVNLPPAKDGDITGFRSLVDHFESALREMRSMIIEVTSSSGGASAASPMSTDDVLLAPLLASKLPKSVHLEWMRKTESPSDRFNLDKLLVFVKREVDSLEAVAQMEATPGENKLSRSDRKKQMRTRGSTSALLTQRSAQSSPAMTPEPSKTPPSRGRPTERPCTLCHGEHRLFSCSKFTTMSPAERNEVVKTARVCSNCLSPGHGVTTCTSWTVCRTCGQRHHSLLHWNCSERSSAPQSPPNRSYVTASGPSERIVLQTALVLVNGRTPARALIDTGSERSYATQALVDRTRPTLLSSRVSHRIETFGGSVSECDRSLFRMTLRSRHGPSLVDVDVIAVPAICSPSRGLSRSLLSQLGDEILADDLSQSDLPIDLLLGMDVIPTIVGEVAPQKRGKLIVTPTIFGCVVGGTAGDQGDLSRVFTSKVLRMNSTPNVSSLWELDTIGVPSPAKSEPVVFPVFKGDRYEVGLPWLTENRPALQFAQAQKRAQSFFRLPPERQEEYSKALREYERLGILEPADSIGGNFIPHHGIQQKKLRIVYDASAKPWKGPALNECLWEGANLLADLTAILLRFRTYAIPLTADVEKAFLMVGVREEDREFLKIVWFDTESARFRISRFCRVPFGICCGPYLLLRTIQHHLDALPRSPTVDLIRRSLYMDDLIGGDETEEEVRRHKKDSVEIFRGAGMNLRGFDEDPSSQRKVLGIRWTPDPDVLEMSTELRSAKNRREVLAAVASIFDPIGFLSPWMIRLKRFLQSLWLASGADWDSPMLPDQLEEWSSLFAEAGPRLIIRRWIGPVSGRLIVFADASPAAYAAVVYLQTEEGDVKFLFSKARVAPLKPDSLTVPKLELMGALLATRALAFIRREMELAHLPALLFSDSMIVLGWIRKMPTDVFVTNRVREILRETAPHEWAHVPGEENPADLATRGLSPKELLAEKRWLRPSLLWMPESIQANTALISVTPQLETTTSPFPFERFGKYWKMVRVTAWIRRFGGNSRGNVLRGPLSTAELDAAKVSLLIAVQQSTEEYSRLLSERTLPSKSSLWDARPFLQEGTGLILCRPRYLADPLPWLPTPSGLARLLVQDIHAKLYHAGAASTRAELLRSFWLGPSRPFVKEVLRCCSLCRRQNARKLASPEGPLPAFRSTPTRPFGHVGLDHFGPLFTKDGSKTWVLLFTCAVTRAVHLELVLGLDMTSNALAIRRFVARRGMSTFWISDNGATFRLLAKSIQGVATWSFIPAAAPWWGGFWERMVGTIKRSLRTTLQNASLSLVELETVICEVEDRVNRRPLITIEDEVLSPAHFLLGADPPALDRPLVSPLPPGADSLFKRVLHRNKVAADLWSRWERDYLTTLRSWRSKPKSKQNQLKPGDVVLVSPPDGLKTSRNCWPLAKVVRLLSGVDGAVRAVELQIGSRKTTRPVSRLCLLEAVDPCVSLDVSPCRDIIPTSNHQITRSGRNIRVPSRYDSS